MPQVSVIMNVWNGAATLREAIASVLSQTFHDWELIFYDDGSTDKSLQIVAEFSDPRIHVFSAITGGERKFLGQAREAAARLAHGEWLAFLDQDDIWLPRKLELQMACADSPQVGLVYGRTLAFGGRVERDDDAFHEYSPLPEGDILSELLGKGCFIAMSSAMLRRVAVLEGGAIPERIRVTPDYYWYATVCGKYRARAVQEVVCRYRIHEGSMTGVYRRESLEESIWIVERWRESLSPRDFQRRQVHLSTALAVEDWREGKIGKGLARLLRDGSWLWLAGRPFVHVWRRIRRALIKPYWKSIYPALPPKDGGRTGHPPH